MDENDEKRDGLLKAAIHAVDLIRNLTQERDHLREENRRLNDQGKTICLDNSYTVSENKKLREENRQLQEEIEIRDTKSSYVCWRCKRRRSSVSLHQPFGVNTTIVLLCSQCYDIITNATPGEEQGP